MSLVIVNQGEQALLEDGVTGVAYTLRLFKTDVTAGLTPSQIDELTEADFVEATFTGYSAAAVAAVDWTVTAGNPTEAVNVEKSFTSTATQDPQNIWGYYLTRDSDGALVWFEQFDGPVVVEQLDDEIQVTPAITLDDREGNAVETGTVTFFAGDTAPTGWLLCDGTAVSRSTFADLFAVIGTAYGPGDGSTTFNVPDLRQRFPLGKADAGTGAALGDTGGTIDHTHGLDTASSHAKMLMATVDPDIRIRRKSTASWAATLGGTGVTVTSETATQTLGIELGGDSDSENPPFVTFTGIIKT